MQFLYNYTTEAQLKSLSERLSQFCTNNQSPNPLGGTATKSENLKHNLSFVISHIILNLKFTDRSKGAFESIISAYNSEHKTSLSFDDFKNIHWIREVHDEVLMPAAVKHFIWKIGYDESQGETVEIPVDKLHINRCLQIYHRKCFENAQLTISPEKLNEVIEAKGSPELSSNYFEKNGLVAYDKESSLFIWRGGDCERYLSNEIAATLWLLIAGENATITNFKLWHKLIRGTGIWVRNLSDLLSHANIIKISELALEQLYAEKDLIQSDDEFAKTWLDSEGYRHTNINTEIPVLHFDHSNAYNYIESVQYHKWRFQDAFDYQRMRSFCYLLIRLVINNCKPEAAPYPEIKKLLKDTSRPFLEWTLFKEIPKEFAQVIPYLLTDVELAPLAFQQIDKTTLNVEIISKHRDNEKQFEDSCTIKNEWWFEMFDLLLEQLDGNSLHTHEDGKLFAKILLKAAKDTFYNANNRHSMISHTSYKKRYDEALKKFSYKRIAKYNTYPSPTINPRILFFLIPGMVQYLKEWHNTQRQKHTEMINITSGFLDICIETLKFSSTKIEEQEITAGIKEQMDNSINELAILVKDYLLNFYTVSEIDVSMYFGQETERRRVRRSSNEFGFEIINWGFLYLKLFSMGSFDKIKDGFALSLAIKKDTHRYDDENREQVEKIKTWLKSLMLAFISVHQNKQTYEAIGLPVKDFSKAIELLIVEYALTYSTENIADSRIDIFDETYSPFGYDLYHEHLTSLLFNSINLFEYTKPDKFITDFFLSSVDIGRMLSAINILNSPELKELISGKIININIETFIKSSSTVTELQYALLDAVNSESHWSLAKPLIERIQKHYQKIKHHESNVDNLLFEVSLLLYFKEKDFDKLNSIALPKSKNHFSDGDNWADNTKRFYLALYKLYNDKDYSSAVKILKSLLSAEEKNIRYAFHIFRAQTLKAIKEKDSEKNSIVEAWQEWEEFVSKLDKEHSKGLHELSEQINSYSLIYYVAIQDTENFDRIVNKLSKRFLFDDEIIPTIYKYYTARGLHELAFDYITKAETYLKQQGTIPVAIQELLEKAETPALLKNLRLGLEKISSIKPANIPQVSPEIINDKRNLNEFILNEILLASQVLRDKIHGIKQTTHEDRFTDLLLASLRLRFPFWGWSITDQPRLGSSPTGKNAGETDIIIQAAGKNIALLEALILKGCDFPLTSKHLLKCFDYVAYLNRYYIIIYYKGLMSNFDSAWVTYKDDVKKVPFPEPVVMDTIKGFEDMEPIFDNSRNIHIAKTSHQSNVSLFHVMINMAEAVKTTKKNK